MNGVLTRPAHRARTSASRRKVAAVGVAAAVLGLMGAASAFQQDPAVAVATVIAPASVERDAVPSEGTAPLVDVLGGSLTAEQALESCRETLRALASIADVQLPAAETPDTGDDVAVKDAQESCAAVLDVIRAALEDADGS